MSPQARVSTRRLSHHRQRVSVTERLLWACPEYAHPKIGGGLQILYPVQGPHLLHVQYWRASLLYIGWRDLSRPPKWICLGVQAKHRHSGICICWPNIPLGIDPGITTTFLIDCHFLQNKQNKINEKKVF